MHFHENLSDTAALGELGRRIAQYRLNRNLSQAEFAELAGVSRSTVSRLEGGKSTQTSNLVRILRALDLLGNIDALVPEPAISPVQLLQREGKSPQRASRRSKKRVEAAPWSWGDGE